MGLFSAAGSWLRRMLADWDVLPPLDAGELHLSDPRQAVIVHWLLTNPKAWMVRRVEGFRLLDDRTVERRTSLDFQLPASVLGEDLPGALRVLPLATLSKRKLSAFDLRDEDGRTLPVLDTRDNGTVATTALHALAETVLGRPAHGVTQILLENIARAPRSAAESHRAGMRRTADAAFVQMQVRLWRAVADAGNGWAPELRAYVVFWLGLTAEWRALEATPTAQQLMDELAGEFILLTPVAGPVLSRRVLKMSYEETFEDVSGHSPWRWLAVRLGLSSAVIGFVAPGTGRCRSYHAELSAPEDAELLSLYVDDGAYRWDYEPASGSEPRGRHHVQVSDGNVQEAGQVIAHLRARRPGLLRSALLTCGLAFALLLGGRLSLARISGEVEATAAILLLVPGVLAAYILRPGEHALVTSLLSGVRAIVLAVASSAVAAAALLVARVNAEALEFVWTSLTAFVGILSCVVVLSNLRPNAEELG